MALLVVLLQQSQALELEGEGILLLAVLAEGPTPRSPRWYSSDGRAQPSSRHVAQHLALLAPGTHGNINPSVPMGYL